MATGGITPVEGASNNHEILSLAEFAVQEHNIQKNAELEYVRVVSAKEQVVAGTIYYITLAATDDGEEKLYEATVWIKPWEDNFKKLEKFILVDEALIDA